MAKIYVLFNPFSDNGNGEKGAHRLDSVYSKDNLLYKSLIDIDDFKDFFQSVSAEDKIIICGGDGTLNCFVNKTANVSFNNEILYFPSGTGNDFARDLGHKDDSLPFSVKEYITNLPCVTVKNKKCYFINGIGYGIDGYCCEVGDRKKQRHAKKINYTSIAVLGLLFHFKPTNATITVDGKTRRFNKVWLAPTMNGRYYGGGVMPTPNQKRNSGELSVMVFHKSGRLKALLLFPSVLKGNHIKFKKYVEIFTGKDIKIEFERPTPLQIDGETILDVTSYSAHS